MTAEKLLSPTTLRKLLRYEPETGNLFWRERTLDLHPKRLSQWNGKFAGKPALTRLGKNGYFGGSIFNKSYTAHRVIWAIVHGEWPKNQIDHINGIRDDNRISNLRAVSAAENQKNMRLHSHNTSGACGVVRCKRRGKWVAQIMVNGKTKYLGCSEDFDEAVAIRKAAQSEYGFHPNHGRNAN